MNSVVPQATRPLAGLSEIARLQAIPIHAQFFKGAILVVLTLGAFWGALLLVGIGREGSFTGIDSNQINAHGHAQIFGWVGLFAMGFVYEALPRFSGAQRARAGIARTTLWMMLTGIVLRTGSQTILTPATGAEAFGALGSGLEIAAVTLFAASVWQQIRGCLRHLDVFAWFILCGCGWFLIQAVFAAVYYAAFLAAVDQGALVTLISNWQAPLRDIQIHGFALMMMLGIMHGVLREFYAVETGTRRRNLFALAILNLALVGEVLGFVLMRQVGHAWAALWYGSILLMAGALILQLSGWKLFSPVLPADSVLKFFRAAYVWLFISIGMYVLLPAYQFGVLPVLAPDSQAATMGFSHAYYGAVRHALTVGFVSLVIVGSVARAVPAWGNSDRKKLPGFVLAFALINTGCALRVFFQTASDSFAPAYSVLGISGFLEFTALVLWGVGVWYQMGSAPPESKKLNKRIFRQRNTLGEGAPDSMCRAPRVRSRAS